MFKHTLLILMIPALALFCQCNNANANKSSGGNSKPAVVKEEQATTTKTTTTVKSVEAPVANMPAPAASEMSVANNTEADMLYTSKDDAKTHATKRKDGKNIKDGKIAYTKGNFPEGSERKLTEWDVTHLSKWGYTLMLNEIYARHNMIFADPRLVKYFRKVKWYKPRNKNVDKLLTPIERENIAFLRSPAVVAMPR